jgi:membrane-bound ClpP family serine protease
MIVIGEKQREYQAVSGDESLARNTRVRVLAVNGDNSLTVTRA